MTVPIANPEMTDAEKAAVEAVLDGGRLADGPVVREFEDNFADFCDTERGIATSNGTTALHAALEALDIGPGDRVLTTPFSFVASANAIRFAGAEPIFADVNPYTFNLDPHTVEAALRRDPEGFDAILVVHLFGRPAELDRFGELAEEYDLALIEDAAQAHGAEFDGRRVGTFGDAACFSFYPTKNMTTGEGGMIVTDREDVADAAARFVNHGRSDTYAHAEVGHNFRMTSLAAAIGNVQLEKLPEFNRARRRNAERLTAGLEASRAITPSDPERGAHVYHQYTIRYKDRDGLADHLDRHDIDTAVYYPTPIHELAAYDDVTASAPCAERVAEEVLSLPVHPGVSDEDVDRIAEATTAYTEEHAASYAGGPAE